MRHSAYAAGAARLQPAVWILFLALGSFVLVVLAGREADRASRTAQVLMRDYASFVADKFLKESADRYAALVGMRGFDESLQHPSPFGILRGTGAQAASGSKASLPRPDRPWLRYLFAYEATTGRLVLSGDAPTAEERAELTRVLEGLDPRCGANQTLPFARLGPLGRFTPKSGAEWSGLVQTGERGEVRSVSGLRVDESRLARELLVPMIDPASECQCILNLLPEGLAKAVNARNAASFILRDGAGQVFFRSHPPQPGAVSVTKQLSSGLPLVGWTAEITVSPEAVRPLLPYAGRGTPWLFLAVLGALILGSAALAAQSLRRNAGLLRLRQDFVSNVSHELKTPLTRIRLFNELLMAGKQNDAARRSRYREVIDRECRRLTFLVDNVLDFSRLERGARPPDMAALDLREVVEGALESFRAASDEGRFALRAELQDVPPVIGSAQALGQAVINLLDNAVKYSPPGGPIEVTLGSEDGVVRFSVKDRGCGIAPREQARVFEEFYRVETGDTQRVAGNGLGLALVHRTVTAHGGRVELASEIGVGSVFTMQIPAAKTAPAGQQPGQA